MVRNTLTRIRRERSITPPFPPSKIILTPDALTRSQFQSPLFSTIPPETRNTIFIFSLLSYVKDRDLYDPETHYTRPGYEGKRTYPTNLLWTCKRIYLETHDLPFLLNGHTFTFYYEKAPPAYKQPHKVFPLIPKENLWQITTIRLNMQQYWLEGGFYPVLQELRVLPALKTLRIVLRHGDWWNWELNEKLGIDPHQVYPDIVSWDKMVSAYHCAVSNRGRPNLDIRSPAWGAKFSMIRTLERLEFEFETLTSKRNQLDLIVEFSKYWRFPLQDGKMLVREEMLTEVYGWDGPKSFIVSNPDAVPVEEEELKRCPELGFTYQVRVATWRKC